jgi:hypothetical protein
MAAVPPVAFDDLWRKVDHLRRIIQRTQSVSISSQGARRVSQEIGTAYFRDVRPSLVALGLDEALLGKLDEAFRTIVQLGQGPSRRARYWNVLNELQNIRPDLAARRAMLLGQQASGPGHTVALSQVEQRIITTLTSMLPASALSYEQAVRDLNSSDRRSFRGTAVELRECLREVLDHLAPDDDVVRTTGYKPEPDQKKPTMRQKTAFIMRSRELPDNAQAAPRDFAALIEDASARIVRSTYQRGNVGTHVAAIRGEILQLKMYVDTVLAELLQIHREPAQ